MNKILLTSTLLFILFLAGCSTTTPIAGSSERSQVFYLTDNAGNSMNGQNLSGWTNGTTNAILLNWATEMSIWVQCGNASNQANGNVTISSISYQVSPGNGIWTNGAVSMSGCLSNTSKFDLTDKGVQYLRGNLSFTGTNGTLTMMVSAK